MKRKYRIWQYTGLDIRGVGGVEMHISEVTHELKKHGCETHIGLSPPPAWDVADRNSPLIVHTHGDCWPSRTLRKMKWIQVCHGTSFGRLLYCREYLSYSTWKGSLRDFLLIRGASAAVAVSRQALDEARKYFFFSGPAAVIPNGVDPDLFKPLQTLSAAPHIAFLGRAQDRVKNLKNLLQASELVWKEHQDFKLLIAPGDEAIRTNHPYVNQLGSVQRQNLPEVLSGCRALILCSLYEGDGIVLREAQALGLPVIASDLPALRENVVGYQNALLVNPRDPADIARTIKQVLFDPMKFPAPTPRLRSWSQVADEFLKFYDTLFANEAK